MDEKSARRSYRGNLALPGMTSLMIAGLELLTNAMMNIFAQFVDKHYVDYE